MYLMVGRPADPRELLAALVAMPSVNPEGDFGHSSPGEAMIAGWVANYLRHLGAGVETPMMAVGRPNILAVFEPVAPAAATIVLCPHLDTVGVMGMTVPPFKLTHRGERLHGRGTCDTKGPMAALLAALRRWTRSPARRKNRIRWVVAMTAGEEQGSLGARFLIERGLHADFAVALEPTGLRIVHAAKGVLRLWIETRGRAAHGSRPNRGRNAIYSMLPLAIGLRDKTAPALASRRHSVLGAASLNLGAITGGQDLNIVPDYCRLGLDIRTHPACGNDEALEMVEHMRSRSAPDAQLKIHCRGESFITARDNPWARQLRGVARGWAAADWFCDANVFAAHGIPAVAFGPGSIVQAHTDNEFITHRELDLGADAFYRLLEGGFR